METPIRIRPIPDEERPTVLALLFACYSGQDVDRMPPGRAPEAETTTKAAVVELRRA
jgi:hypothetical protein